MHLPRNETGVLAKHHDAVQIEVRVLQPLPDQGHHELAETPSSVLESTGEASRLRRERDRMESVTLLGHFVEVCLYLRIHLSRLLCLRFVMSPDSGRLPGRHQSVPGHFGWRAGHQYDRIGDTAAQKRTSRGRLHNPLVLGYETSLRSDSRSWTLGAPLVHSSLLGASVVLPCHLSCLS